MEDTQVVYVIMNGDAGVPFYAFTDEDKARKKLQDCVNVSGEDYSLEPCYLIK